MTRKFELRLTTASLFSVGLLGHDSVDISGAVVTKGDVLSNGAITVSDSTVVNGDVTGTSVTLRGKGHVKSRGHNSLPGDLLPVYMPQLATDLGSISLTGNQTLTLEPGTYHLSGLVLRGNSQLIINNVQEAVTLYVTGNVEVSGAASLRTTATGPEDFSLYVQGNNTVTLVSNGAFYGLIYAPESLLALSGTGDFYGAFVGRAITVNGDVTINYDTTSEVVKAKKAKKAKV
jgi:cytoskeletal protein CcmA (bactofilin family)